MIQYKDVSIQYGDITILENFNLEIARNEKVVLWGKSGCGKSSLLSMIPGFTRPASGSVIVDNKAITSKTIADIRQKIAWLPQEAALPFESVKELIYSPFNYKSNKADIPEKNVILECFGKLGLASSLFDKRVNEVSGGELQRIMIVIAALLNKEILLLDEPTSALDPDSIEKVIAFFQSMKNTTMLAISHDRHFINSFDRHIKIS